MKLIGEPDVLNTSVNMEPRAILVSYEGDMGKYGRVFFNHRLVPANEEESKPHINGFARTILSDGGSERGTLAEVW